MGLLSILQNYHSTADLAARSAKRDGCISTPLGMPWLFGKLGKASVDVVYITESILNTLQHNLLFAAGPDSSWQQGCGLKAFGMSCLITDLITESFEQARNPKRSSPHLLGSLATRLELLAGSQLSVPPCQPPCMHHAVLFTGDATARG